MSSLSDQNRTQSKRSKARSKKENSRAYLTEFHFTWLLVIWTGLLIFQAIEGMTSHFIGAGVLIGYLTGALYYTIYAIPLFIQYILDKLPLIRS